MDNFTIYENGLVLEFVITEDGKVKFIHYGRELRSSKEIPEDELRGFRLVEVEIAGLDRPEERHGTKHIVTAPGYRLVFEERKDYRNANGRKLEIITKDEETEVYVTSHFQFYDGISIIRTWQTIENRGEKERILTYISSFALTGIEKEGIRRADDKLRIGIPHNSWQRELEWKFYSTKDLGLAQVQEGAMIRSSKPIRVSNTGNWSSKEYLPMGSIENTETGKCFLWQIENNGSWHWEISDQTGHLYLQLSGPSENESHWFKRLKPGESFTTVTCAIAVDNGFINAIGEMTRYRRVIRRENPDNEKLGVIFNDYMNCLWADPTTEKEIPLIKAAAEAGCEYYCVDAGWYDKGYWWDSVGEWLPSEERFPGGIKELMDIIREHGMIPGLWLEIEVMGIYCKKAKEVPDDWFFTRHGERIFDRSRYQLDFRNPQVREYASSVIKRLVEEYGVGYIKMDYNVEPGIGTEQNADSVGDGLLQHDRAYLAWVKEQFEKYPELIIENCSSGGLRMDYGLLSIHSIQSTSDQEDYKNYATISANAPTGVTPEQAAVWSYPLRDGDKEETIFNMVNAILLRIHQSGNLAELDAERFALVKEGISCYKKIREDIRNGLPVWPLGLSDYGDAWSSLGMEAGNKTYLSVWKRVADSDYVEIPLEKWKGKALKTQMMYPNENTQMDGVESCDYNWNAVTGIFTVRIAGNYRARTFLLEYEQN